MRKYILYLAGVFLFQFPACAADYEIGNEFITRSFTVEHGLLQTHEIVNHIAGIKVIPVTSPEFSLRLSKNTGTEGTDRIVTVADFKVVDAKKETKGGVTELTFLLKNEKENLKVSLIYSQKATEPYLRKKLIISAEDPICVERIDVDTLTLDDVYQPYKLKLITTKGKWKPGLGQPLYTSKSALFLGTEFPASYNYVDEKQYYCGYQYGAEGWRNTVVLLRCYGCG